MRFLNFNQTTVRANFHSSFDNNWCFISVFLLDKTFRIWQIPLLSSLHSYVGSINYGELQNSLNFFLKRTLPQTSSAGDFRYKFENLWRLHWRTSMPTMKFFLGSCFSFILEYSFYYSLPNISLNSLLVLIL